MTNRIGHRKAQAGRPLIWLLSMLAMLGVVACGPIRLVSPYDEIIDRGTTEVHSRLVTFVSTMAAAAGKPEGTYEANRQFYAEIRGTIASLRIRAGSQSQNEITESLMKELDENVERLRLLHESGKEGGLKQALAAPAMSALEVNCKSIIKFEVAKRRGEDGT